MSKEFPITISSWTLGDQCKFEDRVIAAKNAGYEGIGLRAETYVDALNEGLFDKDILAILDKHGMKVTEVEYIVQWAEEHRSYEQKYKEQLCFHMKKGWAVVKAADCENAKLIMDTWHWVRANQPVDLSVIEDIPADKIVSIQINDVWERPYATTILRDESMHDRLAPGTGIGCTAAFVKMVKEKGIKPNAIGVEVISDAILAKGLEYAANHTYENTKKVLEEAWPEVLQ